MKMNKMMQTVYEKRQSPESLSNIKILDDLLKKGLVFTKCGVFLKAYKQNNKCEDLIKIYRDKTGCEAIINRVYLSEIYLNGFTVEKGLTYAIEFGRNIFQLLKKSNFKEVVEFIISLDDDSCVFRFHTKREGEIYLLEDLEGYDQPVMILHAEDYEP